MERIGDSWNRIYIPQWRKPRVAQEQSFRGEGGGFLSPTPNTRTRPNNFSILLSSRYPVISHHLYVFSRSTGYPCPFVTARGKTHDTPFPINFPPHIFFRERSFTFHFSLYFHEQSASIYFSFQLGDREKVLGRNGFDYFLTFLPC